jgi:pimeloyl-ACP methyl ester carboxylesterase
LAVDARIKEVRVGDPQRATVGDIELVYEAIGDPDDPPVILIMGLGCQLHYWPDGFVSELAGRGLLVVRFDNRDAGLSSHITQAEPVALTASGGDVRIPYTLSDMASDTAGLIGELGHESAHLVGISLGGMIAQLTAIEHPAPVRSLTSIGSTTGNPSVGASRPETLAKLFSAPREPTREAVGEHALELGRMLGSPGFEVDEQWLVESAQRGFDRCYDPTATFRQAAAIATAADRTARLAALSLPTLVVHGSDDPLIDVSGGRATADAVPGAKLLVIDGMGHDLPCAVWPRVIAAIERNVRRGERRRATARAQAPTATAV